MTIITDYTLNPTAKTITLGSDYSTISTEQIVSIRNLSKNILIYDSRDPRKRNSSSGADISITGGVISYVETSTMENTDEIRIEADEVTTLVNVAYSSIVGNSDVLEVYSSESVATSTTINSTAQDIRNVSHANIYIKNSTSTSLTVNVYGSPDSLGTFKTFAGTTTLDTTTTQDELSLSHCPNYLFFEIINGDSSNAATVDISIQRTALTDVVRPYSDVLEVYSSQSVATSTTINTTAQDVRGASYVIPYVKNATSTDLTVNIYGSYNSSGTIKSLVRKYELNLTATQAGDPITKCPNYLFFEILNSDSSNAATVDISILRR